MSIEKCKRCNYYIKYRLFAKKGRCVHWNRKDYFHLTHGKFSCRYWKGKSKKNFKYFLMKIKEEKKCQ